jgi:hypothetical protein
MELIPISTFEHSFFGQLKAMKDEQGNPWFYARMSVNFWNWAMKLPRLIF